LLLSRDLPARPSIWRSSQIAQILFGRPLASGEEEIERIGPRSGIAVLGLDAIASAAYGPEALLTMLLPTGTTGLGFMWKLTLVLITLLFILTASYRQTIDAYPSGGGAYTVAKENLGAQASLLAAAALLLDYLLNVAVAISAGVGALVSAVPRLLPSTLPLCLAVLAVVALVNLRGVRAAGLAFTAPTYLFIACLLTVIGVSVAKVILHGAHPPPVIAPAATASATAGVSTWLLLRAFANGCTAMTGVEAVSNGVPIFRRPQTRNARRTLLSISTILAVLLGGIAFVCITFGITATPPGQTGYQSVLSQCVAATTGRGAFYSLALLSIVSVLTLSANTSFAGFPRVCRLLAADRFLPEPLMHRGRRLVFTHGILVLWLFAGILLVIFRGVTDRLIPLFAIGALFAFTMSQAGMVGHWRKRKGGHAKLSLTVNLAGAISTGLTLCIVLVSKFADGAYISLLLVAGMMTLFRAVRRHYDFIGKATATNETLDIGAMRPCVVAIPIRVWDAIALKALAFAESFASNVVVIQILTDDRIVDDLTPRWNELAVEPARRLGLSPPELRTCRSEYRNIYSSLLESVIAVERAHPDRLIAVVVPQLIELRWYQRLLHSNAATLIRALLLHRGNPQIVVVSLPWYLRDWKSERRRLFGRRYPR
jgi:amino acid transporter